MIPHHQEDSEPDIAEKAPEELAGLKQALAEEKVKAEDNLAGWQRAQADFINYRRRAEQDKAEMTKYANAHLMKSLLPILDDLDRAFACMPADLGGISWVNGLRLIWQKFRDALEKQGLSEIKALGEQFDPNIHEAVAQCKGPDGIVVGEAQKGYKLHELIIRPSKVIVGNGEIQKEES